MSTNQEQPHLLQEGRVLAQVLGDHVETEEVAVDAVSRHGQAVQVLMFACSHFEQAEALLPLRRGAGVKHGREHSGLRSGPTAALTVSSRVMARTKSQVSTVHERTVSVRPSRNRRVMEAS